MGRRGPKPTPTAVLKARGSWRAKTRGQEPRPVRGRPRPPDWLDRVGKHAFRWLVNHLDEMGLLTLSDGKALERYCQLYSRWREAETLLRLHGQVMLVKREDGSEVPRKNPAVAIASDLSHQLARLEADLGLTPAARASLKVSGLPIPGDDPDDEYFRPSIAYGR